MKKNRTFRYFKFLLLILLLIVGVIGCLKIFKGNGADFITGIFKSKTPREKYLQTMKEQGLFSTQLLSTWDSVFQNAKLDTLQIDLPHREVLVADSNIHNSAQAWRFLLKGGRRLSIKATEMPRGFYYGELFRLSDFNINGRPVNEPIAVWDTLAQQIIYENKAADNDALLFLVQSTLDTTAQVELQFLTEPILHFPVAGKDSKAVMSFWGADRDGGKRKHEGNDVLAKRGTPLLAVADGRVSRVKNGGLGGKTVWLRDGEGRGLSYYYAHLSEQLVREGQRVKRGDTVGLVGNSGNARFTISHLHFGIYQYGARDPFPFLKNADNVPSSPAFNIKNQGEQKKVPKRGNHFLRIAPERNGENIRQLVADEKVTVLGVSERFYRVRTEVGEIGYVNFD